MTTEKRSVLNQIRDVVSNWQWWATYSLAVVKGDDPWSANKKATKAVKAIKPIKS